MDNGTYLDIIHLKKYFSVSKGIFSRHSARLPAVNDVSFAVARGETLGLVGESGCGKSTLARLILNLIQPDSGRVMLDGSNIYDFNGDQMKQFRKRVQIIFQDPLSSLNPRKKISSIIGEPLLIHRLVPKQHIPERVRELMKTVGLRPESSNRYPHEFSSGQRQRIGIARALSLNPECIIADEPVSSLDVSIQAQTINLLIDLQQKLHLTYIFISHDLSVVRHVSNRVAVMYLGKIIELAPRGQLYDAPVHPYTEALLSAVPDTDPLRRKQRIILKGEPPGPFQKINGCVFSSRCPIAKKDICFEQPPPLEEKKKGHFAACFFRN